MSARSNRTGILLLDKPLGISSNAALQHVRGRLAAAKAGHVGSLDPLATGMLPICLGEATKIANDILAGRKRYLFRVALGSRTATGDLEGPVVETLDVPPIGAERLDAVLGSYIGAQTQIPPMYSAIKRDGQPLYKLARAGLEVVRAPRPIEIYELSLIERDEGSLVLEAECSKGTYVRSLAEDIAVSLGTCGHVASLRRLYVEPFEHLPMETFESIEATCAEGGIPALLPPDRALQHLSEVRLDAPLVERILHGRAIQTDTTLSGRVRLYAADGRFIGLGEGDGHGSIQPRRLFVVEPR